MCGDKPKEWSLWLPLAEWWYNTNYHSALQLTPYEVVYNQPPPLYLPYLPGETKVEAIDRSLQKREEMIELLKLQLRRAQERMKALADGKRTDRSFNVGDWVWLKLQPYRQLSVGKARSNHKFSARFFGPFQVELVVGKVAYKLKLPVDAQIHNVFHVSQLKGFKGKLPDRPHIPGWMKGKNVELQLVPKAILDRKMVKVQNTAKVQYLVQWEDTQVEDATWEFADEFVQNYPNFSC